MQNHFRERYTYISRCLTYNYFQQPYFYQRQGIVYANRIILPLTQEFSRVFGKTPRVRQENSGGFLKFLLRKREFTRLRGENSWRSKRITGDTQEFPRLCEIILRFVETIPWRTQWFTRLVKEYPLIIYSFIWSIKEFLRFVRRFPGGARERTEKNIKCDLV